ncbi:hypothetical protein FKW77_006138 [Venturia effusa]|uniref:MFS maltose permease n=1 Tax=Venturia effusa TaxID=50376 RepID=A0A517KWI7_9PEZI|nr:hypothetical protein FKW77_006138 [Venturia effusa]
MNTIRTHMRIRPHVRPLRPPLGHESAVRARFFTRNSQLLHLTPGIVRPQLGYLSNGTRRGPYRAGQFQLSRLLTTEHKRFLKEQAWMGGKWTFYGTIISVLGMSWCFLFTHDLAEREFPTPEEWSQITRFKYHSAKGLEHPESHRHNITEWGITANAYRKLLLRLEDPEIDGAGLVEQATGSISIPLEGPMGYDVSSKSYAWKRGYYESLMGWAKCAEHLDGKVQDLSRHHIFEKEYMIGPSNPNPKPCPPWRYSAPLEENCIPAEKPPEEFYHKILTTKGFTRKQRFDAALACGDWFDFKEKYAEAEDMIRYALDIAVEAIPAAAASIDVKSATIKEDAPLVTENLLTATTAMAIHRAQAGDTASALAIFLSVLRARRALPIESKKQPILRTSKKEKPQTDFGVIRAVFDQIYGALKAVEYPLPPPTGDEPAARTPDNVCEEAGLMSYVGEILFSSSTSQRELGWSWTRDALDMAELESQSLKLSPEGRKKCVKCLGVAYENWELMLEKMRRELAVEKAEVAEHNPKTWKSLIGLGDDTKAQLEATERTLESKEEEFTTWQAKIRRSRVLETPETTKPLWSNWMIMIM